jgi:hypothetical protein
MDKEIIKETVAARQETQKQAVLDQLRQIPIVQVACQRASVSRPTFYRLRAEDEKFKTAIEEAIAEGILLINDMSETQLITMIKEKNFSAIHLWLRVHNPRYANKLEIKGRIVHAAKELSPEDKQLVAEALRAAMPREKRPEKSPEETL